MYKKTLIGCLFCGLVACTSTLVIDEDNDNTSDQTSNEVNLSTADGCWYWMENDEQGKKDKVFYLEIEEGQLVSMKAMGRTAKGLVYEKRRSHVHIADDFDVDPPMISLFGRSANGKGSSRDLRIRFDLSDQLSTFDPTRDVNPGILVEEVIDPAMVDDAPLPKQYKPGVLVRTGC